MKIYTRTGDAGSTGLFGGPRVSKDDDRIEAYGTVDELNACLGIVCSLDVDEAIKDLLSQVQSELFSIGAELATPDPVKHDLRIIGQQHIDRLEKTIDQYESTLAPLTTFILPAGSLAAAHLHQARAVCRRAERRVITLTAANQDISEQIVIYLNRLSDLLFVLSRAANQAVGAPEIQWTRPK